MISEVHIMLLNEAFRAMKKSLVSYFPIPLCWCASPVILYDMEAVASTNPMILLCIKFSLFVEAIPNISL